VIRFRGRWSEHLEERVQTGDTPSKPPNRAAAAVILLIAAVVGFAIGSWFGQMTKADAEPGVSPSSAPSISASPSSPPSVSASPSVAAPSPTQAREVLLDKQGSGDFTSETFVARQGWQIQWQTDAGTFDLAVHGDPDIGTISDHPGPVSGVVSPTATGTFQVVIKSDGPWSVTVMQGP
jgi:hypothetical protein